MLTKFCPKCNAIIPITERFCPAHSDAQRHKEYNEVRRDKEAQAFYESDEWKLTKLIVHGKYKGLCLYSLFIDQQIRQADAVHHIVPLREDWSLRVDIGNLIPLTTSAHSLIEQMYKQDKAKAQDLCWDLLRQWNEFIKGVGAVKMF